MATLGVRKVLESGLQFAATAATSDGDEFVNTGSEILVVHNANTSDTDINVTITAQQTSFEDPRLGTLTKSNIVVACNEGEIEFIGPFPQEAFNDTNGKVQITYSAVTNLKVDVIRI